jgi:hypothetical protein
MKNLMVYVTPDKTFNKEYSVLTRVQIDNCLSLGYKKEDIMLVTNFPYEYNGVKSILVSDDNYCACRPRSLKTSIVPHLVDEGIMVDDEIYWNHDLDAYEVHKIEDNELELDGIDAGFTDYGWRSRWCLGSVFVKTSARDIFSWLRDSIFTDMEDEEILGKITKRNTHNINSRIKRMNITYQIGMRRVDHTYKIADKPIKVLHFHPHKPNLLDIFMYGKNEMNTPLMSERMIGVFHHHNVTDMNYLQRVK